MNVLESIDETVKIAGSNEVMIGRDESSEDVGPGGLVIEGPGLVVMEDDPDNALSVLEGTKDDEIWRLDGNEGTELFVLDWCLSLEDSELSMLEDTGLWVPEDSRLRVLEDTEVLEESSGRLPFLLDCVIVGASLGGTVEDGSGTASEEVFNEFHATPEDPSVMVELNDVGRVPAVLLSPGIETIDVDELDKFADWANPAEKRQDRATNDPKPMMDRH
ncbi:uncharacterized protein N0V89_007914 [Didymosphaeria variabile]|uniref:Uncharacterized protein n=1 Tax=Didymosphaeria variabile TaxID=1932322 RepID=A0A9W8XMF1_9PLEO|nr:uncharacterized protein N0V89_007914 [Didymosphaeria variabile]KAJ4352565.1 hypothetical protein N0V89_007914 [Didymosphaeria variabile]